MCYLVVDIVLETASVENNAMKNISTLLCNWHDMRNQVIEFKSRYRLAVKRVIDLSFICYLLLIPI